MELIEKKTSLYGIEDKLTSIRKDGNTTRIIDNAIQLLFKGYTVIVLDHYMNGEDYRANELLFWKIIRRIKNEHFIGINEYLEVCDRYKLEIKLSKDVLEKIKKEQETCKLRNHDYIFIKAYPIKNSKMVCSSCGSIRNLTNDEFIHFSGQLSNIRNIYRNEDLENTKR